MDNRARILRAIDKNIADAREMIAKCEAQADGFAQMRPTWLMRQKTIDRRIALFTREAEQWRRRLAQAEAQRATIQSAD